MLLAPFEVSVAVCFQIGDLAAVMVVGDVVTPVVPKHLHRHAVGRVARYVSQRQTAAIASDKFAYQLRFLWPVKVGAIQHHDGSAFAFCRAFYTLLGQLAEGSSIAFLTTDAHNVACAPVDCRHFVAFHRADAWRSDLALFAATHPHACQCRECAQLGFILHIDVCASRRMCQKPCDRPFFCA